MLCQATNRAIPLSHFEHKGRIEPLDRLVRVAALVADDPRLSDPIIGRGCARRHWFFEPLRGRTAVVATTGRAVSSGLCGSSGIRFSSPNGYGNYNYSKGKNLRKNREKNLKTRSDTSRLSPPPWIPTPFPLCRPRNPAANCIRTWRYGQAGCQPLLHFPDSTGGIKRDRIPVV
jgi:hypothetical protein